MARSIKPMLSPSSPPAGAGRCARVEQLVGHGFRRGYQALEMREPASWAFAWQAFANAAGPEAATELVADLSLWVRAVRKCSGRSIETLPAGCPGFCRDECLAISMIAATQQCACPALKACAFALLASNQLDEPLRTAERFGARLAKAGQLLSPDSICDGLAVMRAPVGRPS